MRWCDLHIHTNYSDGNLPLCEVVDLYGQAGFGAIAITDHLCDHQSFLGVSARCLKWSLRESNFQEYLDEIKKEAARALEEYSMLIVPGVEITYNSFLYKRSAHVLLLGIDHYIDPNQSLLEILNEARNQGALSVAAHPVSTKKREAQTYYLWENRKTLREHIDLWEAASGSFLFEEVVSANLPIVANSDFHRRSHFSSWKTLVPSTYDFQDLKSHLKSQRIRIQYFNESGGEYVQSKSRECPGSVQGVSQKFSTLENR